MTMTEKPLYTKALIKKKEKNGEANGNKNRQGI